MSDKAALVVLLSLLTGCATATAPTGLKPRRITLSAEPVEQPLLSGPPQTGGMRSGRVVLQPGAHMHTHSTNGNEELLVFLAGKARVTVGSEVMELEAGQVLYIPPFTVHALHNEGPEELRYIYTVAPAGR